MTYTILAYTIVIIAAIGLLSNFLFIFFMDENDKLNGDISKDISKCPYLNGEKDGL
jgi:Co/Zn/Cd efflux system component